MDARKIQKLLELISDIVEDESSPWRDKRDEIGAEAGELQKTNLYEFCSWFDEELS